MNYSINIDHNLKIIRYKHKGVVDLDQIGKAWKEFLKMKEFTELKYNLLSDYRDAKFSIDIALIPELIDFLQSLKDIIHNKKQSLIVNDPYSTAASMIFQHDVNEKIGFIVKVFSTEEAALKWLIS